MRISDWSSDVCSSDRENVRTRRDAIAAQPLEHRAEQVRPRAREQSQRREMAAGIVGHNDIGGEGIVEPVDLEPTIDGLEVPIEQIDEKALARLEHGVEQRLLPRLAQTFDDMKNGIAPLACVAQSLANSRADRKSTRLKSSH